MNSCRKELSILLDPGVVFGAGTHTTTQDCLKALELVFSREKSSRFWISEQGPDFLLWPHPGWVAKIYLQWILIF